LFPGVSIKFLRNLLKSGFLTKNDRKMFEIQRWQWFTKKTAERYISGRIGLLATICGGIIRPRLTNFHQ